MHDPYAPTDIGVYVDREPDPDRQHDDPDWGADRIREQVLYDAVHADGERTEDEEWEDEDTHTHCSVCSHELPEPWTPDSDGYPLCGPCEKTARAAGRQAADAQRYPDPEQGR